MPFDPLGAVGAVIAVDNAGIATFTGTCFLFRHSHCAVTAAHCVPETAHEFRIELPRLGRAQRVVELHRHPQADVAVLLSEPVDADDGQGYPAEAFWDAVGNWGLGEQYMIYGFPSEGPTPDAPNAPTPRAFVGHFQRFFDYVSPSGYRYLAAELSGEAPSGLSGGPIFRQAAPQMLTGVVTANLDSYAVTDSMEEVRDGGSVYRLESRRVVSYGVGLVLSSVTDWLKQVVPDRPGMGWVT